MAGWFELSKSTDDQFRFVLKADNAQTILTSQQYAAQRLGRRGHRFGASELFRRREVRAQDIDG